MDSGGFPSHSTLPSAVFSAVSFVGVILDPDERYNESHLISSVSFLVG